jgi:hypothetical protein
LHLIALDCIRLQALEEQLMGIGLHQPLVITMAAGFVVVNFTPSRRSFLRILRDSSEPVYADGR